MPSSSNWKAPSPHAWGRKSSFQNRNVSACNLYMREIGVGKEEEGGEGRRPFSFFLPFSFFPLPAREQFRGGIFISQPRILFLFPPREEPNYFLFFSILFREKERGNGDFGLKGEKEDVFFPLVICLARCRDRLLARFSSVWCHLDMQTDTPLLIFSS